MSRVVDCHHLAPEVGEHKSVRDPKSLYDANQQLSPLQCDRFFSGWVNHMIYYGFKNIARRNVFSENRSTLVHGLYLVLPWISIEISDNPWTRVKFIFQTWTTPFLILETPFIISFRVCSRTGFECRIRLHGSVNCSDQQMFRLLK